MTNTKQASGSAIKDSAMTQKNMLMRVLKFASAPYSKNVPVTKAARAFCIVSWLHDMNWHSEADAIEKRVHERLADAWSQLEADTAATSKLHCAASLFNYVCGWGLARNVWLATQEAALVEELWGMVSGCSGTTISSQQLRV
jgi:hypothetical protein